jgi:hypothetical protein
VPDEKPHEGRCGARTRSGGHCRQFPIPGKRRCHYHGGRSTGPKTQAGIRRIQLANTKHGRYSKRAIAERRRFTALLRHARKTMREIAELGV